MMSFLLPDVRPLLDIQPLWHIREPFSTLSHLAGALLSLVATVALTRRARKRGLGRWGVRRMVAYGLTLVFVFGASTAFHFPIWAPNELVLLKKLDHAAIFLTIAGTSTAIYGAVRRRWTTYLTIAMWVLTVAGGALRMLVWPMPLWLTAALYLTLGWMAASGLLALMGRMDPVHKRLLFGGVASFTVGAVVFATKWPILWQGVVEAHELFHVFVLAGAALFFAFVYRFCTHPDLFDLGAGGAVES
jgi:hemolysin III